ncbi:MAG TPA: aldo/keto reductase [Acidimicrobiales bacterium]|nr:aldo/keto reductase [Acidimicrobiales bacterium]
MRYVEVGGVKVSSIGLGAWQFGAQGWDYGDEYLDKESQKIVDRALDLGVNLIDTAEVYGDGRSEEVVGRTIAARRGEVFLATKVFPGSGLDADEVVKRARASAERLGVDRIDLYQQHWPSPDAPAEAVMAGMRRLQQDGLVTHVGVSNFSTKAWQEAEQALGGAVLSNQVRYSLVARRPEQNLIPRAAADGRIVIAYSPLGQGFLSGRYDGTTNPGGVRARNPLFRAEVADKAKVLTTALSEVAAAHGATAAQVALAWVVRRPNVVAIPGASSAEQMEQNAAAADIELTQDEDARLGEASAAFAEEAGELLRG